MATTHPRAAQPAYAARGTGAPLVTIYKVVFLPEGRAVYTGRTLDPQRRLAEHGARSSGCRLMRDAIRRHGAEQFAIVPIVRCAPEDADANESHFIQQLDTMHPKGFNLRHGSCAGKLPEDTRLVVPPTTKIVPLAGARDRFEAQAEAAAAFAELCDDEDRGADDVCRQLLRETHPDRNEGRTYSAHEVTAMLNQVRQAARREGDARVVASPPTSRYGRKRGPPKPFWLAADRETRGHEGGAAEDEDEEEGEGQSRQPRRRPPRPLKKQRVVHNTSPTGHNNRSSDSLLQQSGDADESTSTTGKKRRIEPTPVASGKMCEICKERPASLKSTGWKPCFGTDGRHRCQLCGKWWYQHNTERPPDTVQLGR